MSTNKADIQFSPIIIGTMRLGEWGANMRTDELERFIDQCVDLGLTDFDHADIYGHYTEEGRFGQVMKRRPDLRSKVQLTTKCGIKLVTNRRPSYKIKSYDSTAQHIITSAERSLQELGVSHLDVLLIHRPDYLMDVAEMAEAFTQLQQAGKVKAFGISNFTTDQAALLHSYFPLVTHQIEISLLHREALENGTLNQCQQLGMVPTAWSPFGGGRIFAESDDEQLNRIRVCATEIGAKYEAGIDQVLLAWLFKHPAKIAPIVGSTKIQRIERALQATQINLTHEEWYELLEAATGTEVP